MRAVQDASKSRRAGVNSLGWGPHTQVLGACKLCTQRGNSQGAPPAAPRLACRMHRSWWAAAGSRASGPHPHLREGPPPTGSRCWGEVEVGRRAGRRDCRRARTETGLCCLRAQRQLQSSSAVAGQGPEKKGASCQECKSGAAVSGHSPFKAPHITPTGRHVNAQQRQAGQHRNQARGHRPIATAEETTHRGPCRWGRGR